MINNTETYWMNKYKNPEEKRKYSKLYNKYHKNLFGKMLWKIGVRI